MIENELLLLGLLRESPKHGYDIKLKIQEILSLFAGLNIKSIYYPLRILEKKGLITKKINRMGKRPERLVYALTSKGRERFDELLTKSLLDFKRPQFSLDLSLYFLRFLKPSISRRRLRARLLLLNKLAASMRKMLTPGKKMPASLSRVLEHNIKMVEAESSFIIGLIKSIT